MDRGREWGSRIDRKCSGGGLAYSILWKKPVL
jgi:hypothetical protein